MRPPLPPLFALTGQSPIHRADVVSPFSRSLGLLRRGPEQGPRPDRAPRPVGVCHGPCSLAGDSPLSYTGDGPPGRVCPVPPVPGERHTLQTLKPGGFNQWLGACRELAPSKQESTTYEPSPVCKLLILSCRLLIPDRLLATQNPQRNSGSEPSRRPFGKTRSAPSPGPTSPFRASTVTRSSGRPRTASASTTCSSLPSSPTRRTRSLPSATPRRRRRPAMAKLRKMAAPSGGGFTPVAFFLDARAAERTARASRTTDHRAGCSGRYSLYYGTGRERPAQRILKHFKDRRISFCMLPGTF